MYVSGGEQYKGCQGQWQQKIRKKIAIWLESTAAPMAREMMFVAPKQLKGSIIIILAGTVKRLVINMHADGQITREVHNWHGKGKKEWWRDVGKNRRIM